MERETGIEPATNSLEGCDSTTELLPPSRSCALSIRASAGHPAVARSSRQSTDNHSFTARRRLARQPDLVTSRHSLARGDRERRLVAREGLEPSKPLGRQIYSLLRLTASLPRQLCVLNADFERSPRDAPWLMELAKGFEPPTC